MRFFCKLLVIVTAALLYGCANIPSAGISDAKNLPLNGGLVAVQVVTNSAHLSDAVPNWSQIFVVQEGVVNNDGKPILIKIPALVDGLSTTRVFVGVLKPGRYRFAGLYSFTTGSDRSHSLSARAPPTVGSFEVQTDRLTNLGTVLFQPFHPDPLATTFVDGQQKSSYAMSRLDDAASLADFVAQRYPTQYARTKANPELGWVADQFGLLRTKLANATKEYAMLSHPYYTRKQEIVYTARLGTLYRRQVNGPWSTCHVPTNYELLAYGELTDGTTLVGGERGSIWYATKYCGDWHAIPLPDRLQNVVWIGTTQSSAVHVIAHEQGRYRIYVANLDGRWDWQLIKEYGAYSPISDTGQVFQAESQPSLIEENNNTLWLYDRKGGYRFDTAQNTFESSSSPAMVQMINQPNGIVVAAQFSAWMGSKPPQISHDNGHSWDQYERLGTFRGMPYLFSNNDSLAVNSSSTYVFIGWKKNEKIEILLSHDRGKTSEIVGYVPYGCDQLQTSISRDDLLFMRCFDGSLLKSIDHGHTWSTDFNRAVRADAIPAEFFGSGIDTEK